MPVIDATGGMNPDCLGIALRKIERGDIVCLPPGFTVRNYNVVWIALQVFTHKTDSGEVVQFQLIGVFTTEEKAVAACKEPTDCVAPIQLDAIAPRNEKVLIGAYYPLEPKAATRPMESDGADCA
jgi:hypothetical protein